MSAAELLLTLVNRSLAACWLILAIVLLRPFLRRVSPSISCALWGLVAIRLLCPFTVESILSLIPSAQPIPTEAVLPQTQLPTGLPAVGGDVGGTSLPSSPLPSGTPASSAQQLLMRAAVTIWLVGIVVFAAYLLVSYLRLHLHAREAVLQEGGYWLCDRISSPFVLGVFRPRILLPYTADAEDIPYIMAHERAHLARRDHWRKPVGFALLAVFWFQPFLWLAYFLLCRDIEFACDERALRTLGTDAQNRKCYANALLHGVSSRMSVIACPVAFGGVQIKRRVKSVLRYRKPAVLLIIVALLVCAVVAVCFLSDPVSGGTADDSSAASEPSADAELKAEDFYPFYGMPVKQDFSVNNLFRMDTPPVDEATLTRMVADAENAGRLSAESPTHLPVFRFETEKAWNTFRKTYDISNSDTEFDTFAQKYGHLFGDHVLILLYAPNGMARWMGDAYQCDGRLVQVLRGTGRQVAGEPSSLYLYFLPRSELDRYPEGLDAVVYPAEKPVILPDDLPYDPLQRLEELKERDQWGSTNGFFYLEGILAGEIDPTAPKLDEETAKRILSSYPQEFESFEKIMEEFAAIQLYPDWTGGSGFALAEYWFDDMGDKGLFINLTTRDIFYFTTAPGGSQLPELQEKLFTCRP